MAGTPTYVSCFDFDQDGDIDFADLHTFQANFGAQGTFPTPPPWIKGGVFTPAPTLPTLPVLTRPGSSVTYAPTPHVPFGNSPESGDQFFGTAFGVGSPFPTTLYGINPLDAGLSQVGPTQLRLIGLNQAPNVAVYGMTVNGFLGTVDTATGAFSTVTQYPGSFPEGDIAFRPGEVNRIWITTGRTLTSPPYLIQADLSGNIISQVEIPVTLTEFGFSGMQFKDANTLYLYEPETRKLVITDVHLSNAQQVYFAGGSLGVAAGIDFDSTGRLWIVNKPSTPGPMHYLYYVDDTVQPWQLVPQGPGTTMVQWNGLVILQKPPVAVGEISGVKWHDLNANRVRDPGEPGLPGWHITITGSFQGQVYTATTVTLRDDPQTPEDESGRYLFRNVPYGTYQVLETNQPGWIQSWPAPGMHQVTIDASQPTAVADFGNFRLGRIHGMKLEDRGPLPGRGLEGWQIVLRGVDALGQLVHRSMLTVPDNPSTPEDETGQYWFEDLMPGTYRIEEVLQPDWFVAFPELGLYDITLQSDANLRLDFRNYRGGTISGQVFHDRSDCEGPFTQGDVPLPNMLVYIDVDDDGILDRNLLGQPTEPTAWTGANGMYQFTGLPYGQYRVRHEVASPYAISYPSSQSYLVTIGFSGQVIAEIDFGVFIPVPLEDGGDRIHASWGADTVYGDNIVRNRCVRSYGGDDRIYGEEGNDLLIGQRRHDTYYFLPNSAPSEIDTIIELDDRRSDDRDDEGYRDRLDFSALGALEPVEVDLSGTRLGWPPEQIAFYQSNVGQHTILTDVAGQHNHIEDVLGGAGDDMLTGNPKANWLNGGLGSDQLFGLDGDDVYAFGPFAPGDVDSVQEQSGSGGGTDTLDFAAIVVPVTVDLNSINLAAYGGANVISSTSQWLETVIGGRADDLITGNQANNRLEGGPNADTFVVHDTVAPIRLRGNDGDDQYTIEFGSLLGAVTIDDNATSALDRVDLIGTGSDDVFVVNSTSTTLLTQQVYYNSAIEQLYLMGGSGDDTFDATPSATTEMFLDGGANGLPGDSLTVHALGQSFMNTGTQVLVTGYQPVHYANMENVTVAPLRGIPKTRDAWTRHVDKLFALDEIW